jgi:hypothetical protein
MVETFESTPLSSLHKTSTIDDLKKTTTTTITTTTTSTSMPSKTKNNKSPPLWRTSEAKESLRLLLEEDQDNFWHDLDPTEVYQMSPLFQDYDENCFLVNLRSLKQSIKKEKDAVAFDQTAFLHDRQLFPVNGLSSRGYTR